MTHESSGTIVIDEIDRLFVVYDKAKEYINKILHGINHQTDLWQYRRQIIFDQMKSTSSFDFLLPKTQRINELAIEAVQALCRVDLLIEQILHIDPKSSLQTHSIPRSTSFSARSLDTNVSHSTATTVLSRTHHVVPSPSLNSINQQQQQSYTEPTLNGKTIGKQTLPMPVLRTSQPTPSNRLSLAATQEKTGFKPIEQQRTSNISENTSRPTPIHPQTTHYPATEGLNFAYPRTPNDKDSLWPDETNRIFREEVADKIVEVSFANTEEGTEQWPLHFVRITVGNQTITNLLSLKQRIEPRPNRFIAEQLANSLTHQEYILFNVPITEEEFD
ncbi:unnamed protein product [Rotaria sp. Silwood1]|nr:unnamed protein product [Rotaria sp. Silwood1]